MSNRFNINEEEKNRIKGLHNIKEQSKRDDGQGEYNQEDYKSTDRGPNGRCRMNPELEEMGYRYREDTMGYDHHDYEKRMGEGGWFYLKHYCIAEEDGSTNCVPPPIVASPDMDSDSCDILLFWEDEMSPISLGRGDQMLKRLKAWETAKSL